MSDTDTPGPVTAPAVIDMDTAEGAAAWMKTLPDESLRAIAARPLDRFNYLLVVAAEGELIARHGAA